MKKYLIISLSVLALLIVTIRVYAVNVSVPSSPAAGSILTGNANGTYTASTSPLSIISSNATLVGNLNVFGIASSTELRSPSGTISILRVNQIYDSSATSTQCETADPVTGLISAGNCVVSFNNLNGNVLAVGTANQISIASGTGNLVFLIPSPLIVATANHTTVNVTTSISDAGTASFGTTTASGTVNIIGTLNQSGGSVVLGGTTVIGQATTSNLTVTGVTSALHLAQSNGKVIGYSGTSCAAGTAPSAMSPSGDFTCTPIPSVVTTTKIFSDPNPQPGDYDNWFTDTAFTLKNVWCWNYPSSVGSSTVGDTFAYQITTSTSPSATTTYLFSSWQTCTATTTYQSSASFINASIPAGTFIGVVMTSTAANVSSTGAKVQLGF